MLYFDNSTTTNPSLKVVQAMLPFLKEDWGSPTSPYPFGQKILKGLETSVQSIRALLRADSNDHLFLTSSHALAINHVIFSVLHDVTKRTGKNHFLTTEVDEAPPIYCLNRLEEMGCSTQLAEVNEKGYLTKELFANSITPRTALLSLSWGNGLTGVIHPLKEIGELAKQRGILLHIDVSHAIGKIGLNLSELDADFVTFRADTFHGPQGAAALFVRKGLKLSPYVLGSTLDLSPFLMKGFGVATEEANAKKEHVGLETARLRDLFERLLLEKLPECRPLFRDSVRLPHITTIAFPGIPSETLLFALSRKGIAASMGGGNFQQLKLLLRVCKIDPLIAECALSFSFSSNTTDEEIEKGAEIIAETALTKRQLSRGVYP